MIRRTSLLKYVSLAAIALLAPDSFAAVDLNCDPQCVAYVNQQLGLSQKGDAKGWWDSPPKKYTRKSNGDSKDKPKGNDILVWGSDVGGGHGHVAIVRNVDTKKDTITYEDANRLEHCKTGQVTTTLTNKNNRYTVGSGGMGKKPLGWLHKD